MITLVLAMVWARRGQAVTLALLAMVAVTAAVAAPAFLRAADRAVAAGQVATATAAELRVEISETTADQRIAPPAADSRQVDLPQTGSALRNLPGFDYVYAAEFPARGLDPDERSRTLLVYRQDVCAHLVMVSGRCLAGESDVVLGEQTAHRVGYSTDGRRPELAVVALRGARRGQRWWLASGENLLAVGAGALAGCLLGQLLVNAVIAVAYPGVGTDPGLGSLRYAPLATGAAVVTALLAERRHLVSPVTELLRRAPGVPGVAAAVAVQGVVAVLAVVAAVQLKITGGVLTGVGTFAAALIMLASAQLCSRALLPGVSWVARRALRRGRVGVALAAFQLSRRPGATPLFALLVAATAVAGYATCAIDVAARGRSRQAEVGTGADRVLTVQAVDRSALLAKVRAADPQGAYAMAVVRLPAGPGEPAALAVDTTRLAAVTGLTLPLRPADQHPVTVLGPAVSLDLTATGLRVDKPVFLTAFVSSTNGQGDAVVPLDYLREGRHRYTRDVPECRDGCRLNGLRLVEGDGGLDVTGSVTLHGTGATPWRSSPGGPLPPGPDGVPIDLTPLNTLTGGLIAEPDDVPRPLPAVVAGTPSGTTVTGLDGRALAVTPVAHLTAIPGAGRPARLIDLGYVDRLDLDAAPIGAVQVWLNARAPSDITARLEAQGLVIASDTRASQVRRQLDRQGPAVAMVFAALVAVLTVLLAAGALILAAGVDRRRRVEDLSALRGQGLSRRAQRQAALGTYPALVALAGTAGAGVAVLAWWLTGWALPLTTAGGPAVPLPTRPDGAVLAAALLGTLAVLAGVAGLAGRRTLREVR